MKLVTLSAEDVALAARLGFLRRQANANSHSHNKQLDVGRGLQVEIDGVAGELAFCRPRGLAPDLSIGLRKGGADAVYRGLRIDVKATRHDHGRLMVYMPKAGENDYADIDAFVLVRLPYYPPHCGVVGYALKDEVLRDENIDDVGYGPTWFLPNRLIHDIEVLDG